MTAVGHQETVGLAPETGLSKRSKTKQPPFASGIAATKAVLQRLNSPAYAAFRAGLVERWVGLGYALPPNGPNGFELGDTQSTTLVARLGTGSF